MAGIDFDRDFPAPPGARPEEAALPRRRIVFRGESPVRIPLLFPLRIEDEPPVEIEALVLRRLTAGEMIGIVEDLGEEASDAELVRAVTAAMAGIPPDILEALAPDDAGRVALAALPFMPAALVALIERAAVPRPPPDAAA